MYSIFNAMSVRRLSRKGSTGRPAADLDSFVGYEHWNAPVMERAHAKDVMKRLERRIDDGQCEFTSFDGNDDVNIAKFRHSELVLGAVLGKGSFSCVYEIQSIKLLSKASFSSPSSLTSNDSRRRDSGQASSDAGDGTFYSENKNSPRKTVQLRCRDDPSSYVVKILRTDLIDNPRMLASCASDLAKEGAMLASLDHPNILGIRGWTDCGLRGYATGRHDAFFLILDRLHETLADRLRKWRTAASKHKAWIISPNRRRRAQDRKSESLRVRLDVIVQLADALQYLHANRIVHRDLKPDNIGFDFCSGNVKVFDFDLARRLPADAHPNSVFKLTRQVGSPRYMSPECARGERYNTSADTYSFALLMHQVLSLAKPFAIIPADEHEARVVFGGARPMMPSSWPGPLRDMISGCWSDISSERPAMSVVHSELQVLTPRLLADKPKDNYVFERLLSKRGSSSEASASSSRRSWSISSLRRGIRGGRSSKQCRGGKKTAQSKKLGAPQPASDVAISRVGMSDSSLTVKMNDDSQSSLMDSFADSRNKKNGQSGHDVDNGVEGGDISSDDDSDGMASSSDAGSVNSTHSMDRLAGMSRRAFLPTLGTIKSIRMLKSSRSVTALLDMDMD